MLNCRFNKNIYSVQSDVNSFRALQGAEGLCTSFMYWSLGWEFVSLEIIILSEARDRVSMVQVPRPHIIITAVKSLLMGCNVSWMGVDDKFGWSEMSKHRSTSGSLGRRRDDTRHCQSQYKGISNIIKLCLDNYIIYYIITENVTKHFTYFRYGIMKAHFLHSLFVFANICGFAVTRSSEN